MVFSLAITSLGMWLCCTNTFHRDCICIAAFAWAHLLRSSSWVREWSPWNSLNTDPLDCCWIFWAHQAIRASCPGSLWLPGSSWQWWSTSWIYWDMPNRHWSAARLMLSLRIPIRSFRWTYSDQWFLILAIRMMGLYCLYTRVYDFISFQK